MSTQNLRKWQQEALDLWVQRGRKGIVEVATGGGKTRFALACLSTWDMRPSDACIVIVPTLALQDQWVAVLTDEAKFSRASISVWGEDNDVERPIHVMVVNTARDKSAEIASVKDSVFLIADECHRYASPENARSLEIGAAMSLGLTATAEREFDDGLETVLEPNLGEVFYKYTLKDAIKDGVVSPLELSNVRIPLNEEEESQIAKLSRRIGQAFREGDEERGKLLAIQRASVSKKAKARLPAAIQLAEAHGNDRVLIFHEDIASADRIVSLLKERGTHALAYHSKISPAFRRDNLYLFRKGMTRVLVCCRALDEGIDIPEVNVAIVAAATSSQRQRIQRLGRALRLATGKQKAFIYTIYGTDQEQQNLLAEASAMEDVTDTSWKSLESRSPQ